MGHVNWGGNYTYRATRLHRPSSLDELRDVVARAPGIRVLGSRHSFTDIADSGELVTLAAMPTDVSIDADARTVSVPAGATYTEVARALHPAGLALGNLASLPHISVGGSIATATHGSGDRNGNLATAVAGLELVTSTGELVRAQRGDEDFDGLVVGLGALGAVTRVVLDTEPEYAVRQRVFEGLGWDALVGELDAVLASGYSVSVFTRWAEPAVQAWLKTRVAEDAGPPPDAFFGAPAATIERHPVIGLDPVNCTPQLGVPGPWSERLPHFRAGFTPSSGEEIQSEYLLPRRHAVDAIGALRALADTIEPLLEVSEIRSVAADRLWMSPQYGLDTIGIHFTWWPRQRAVERVLADVEAALAPFEARPHWGKLFLADAAAVGPLYPRLADFADLAARLDPRGAFRNAWLQDRVLGPA